jgi:hypothetical protein
MIALGQVVASRSLIVSGCGGAAGPGAACLGAQPATTAITSESTNRATKTVFLFFIVFPPDFFVETIRCHYLTSFSFPNHPLRELCNYYSPIREYSGLKVRLF